MVPATSVPWETSEVFGMTSWEGLWNDGMWSRKRDLRQLGGFCKATEGTANGFHHMPALKNC